MRESDLKRRLVKAILATHPGAVVYRHEDAFTAGIPDISVTWAGLTSWWEVKHEPLGRTSKLTKLQEHELRRLARQTVAGCITYRERVRAGGKVTVLELFTPLASENPITQWPGYSHASVVEAIHVYHILAGQEVSR